MFLCYNMIGVNLNKMNVVDLSYAYKEAHRL